MQHTGATQRVDMSANRAQAQQVDLYQVLAANRVGAAPLTIRTIITPSVDSMMGGVPQSAKRGETYVLLSALPSELQERVKLAIQAVIAGM